MIIQKEGTTGIYKITSPTNKIYIGQSINIENRFRIYYYFKSYKNNIGPRLMNSLNKYGWENHIFETIEECSKEELNIRERYWQDHYNVVSKEGLNCVLTDTSTSFREISQETKDKISKGKMGTNGYPKGLSRPEEFGVLISKATLGKIKHNQNSKYKISNSLMGIVRGNNTQEHNDNISKSSKGISRNKKKVQQFDLLGTFIQSWDSVKDAEMFTRGKSGGTGISSCCVNKQKTAYGFVWKYI